MVLLKKLSWNLHGKVQRWEKITSAIWNDASFLHACWFLSSTMTYKCAVLRHMITRWKMLLAEDFLVLAVLAAVSGWHSGCSCLASAALSQFFKFNSVNIALELETSEGRALVGYYPDRIVASFLFCGIKSCLSVEVSWWWPLAFTITPKEQDGRFLPVEQLCCNHLRGDAVTRGRAFLGVCALTFVLFVQLYGAATLWSAALKYIVLSLFQNRCKI